MSDEGSVSSGLWRFDPELDEICDRFEEAWKSSDPANMATFLREVEAGKQGDLLRELVAIDMEYRWRSAGRYPVYALAEYLQHWPALGDLETVDIALIELEYRLKIEHEHPCDLDSYITTFGFRAGTLVTALSRAASQTTVPAVALRHDELEAGYLFGHFRLIERLGSGSFGSVWKAADEQLHRIVAIKFPLGDGTTQQEQDRFLREARAAARPQHPYIVRVHAFGRERGTIYIVKDWIDGPNLAQWLKKQKPSLRASASLCIKIAEALEHAHNLGIVHRDMKPANVLIPSTDAGEIEPRVTDFGLALTERDASGEEAGKRLGSPAYMSPEQARGESDEVDRRADLYSMGVILFEMLTGERPFRGSSSALIDAVIHEPPPDPGSLNRQLDLDLRTICLKCLEKNPARRYATARELAADLQRWLDGRPIHARPLGPAELAWRWMRRNAVLSAMTLGLIAVLSLGLAGVAWQWTRAEANAERVKQSAERMRLNLYVSELNLVQRIWEQGNEQAGLDVLNQLRPVPGQSDLRCFTWYHWWQRNQIDHRSTHLSQSIECIAVSPDERLLAAAGHDGMVVVIDLATGTITHQLIGHVDRVQVVCFLSTDRLLTGCDGGELRVWDLSKGICVEQAELPSAINDLAVTSDGNRVFIAAGLGTLHHCSADLSTLETWSVSDSMTESVAICPHDQRIAVGTASGKVRLLDAESGEFQRELEYGAGITDLEWSPNGTLLAACGKASSVIVWDASTGEEIFMNRQPRLTYFKVAFSQNGRRLYVAGDDTYIQCFDPLASSRLDRIIGHEDSVTGLAVLKNGSLVSGSRDSTVKRWKSGSDASVARPDLHTKRVKSVAFAPTGYLMASTGYDGTVQLYDVAKRQIVKTLRDDPSRKMSLAFSPTGEHLAAADVDSGRVLVWNVPQGTLQHTWQSGADRALSICFTRSGQLVAGCGGGHISVWDLSSGECIAMFEAHDGEDVFAVHASPVDNIVASGGWDGKVILWDSRTWQPMKTIATADIRINGLQISPDGRMFAATTSRNVELWDMRTYSRITTLSGHQRAVNPPAFSPDGITLASGSWDGTVRLWDLRTFSEKTSFPAHSNGVAFSADGCYLVSAGPHEPYVTVWSATDMGD